METFGAFETIREIEAAGGAVVYEARKQGDVKRQYAIKLFQAGLLLAETGEEARAELGPLVQDLGASFAARVELQKRAAAGSPYFAPIFASEQDERGAWYATLYYARSVGGMLERFASLEAEDVYHIADSLVQASLHLKQTVGRSHGNLKLSNVFIAGEAKPRSSQVVVADPLPGDRAEAERYERADLRSIGELIYQCVLKRKTDFTWVIVPLEATPEWKKLFAAQAAGWMDLCNRLLDPQLTPQKFSLEQLAAALRKLKPKASPLKVVVPAAVLVLLAGGALFWFLRPAKTGKVIVTVDPPGSQVSLYSYIKGQGATNAAQAKPVVFSGLEPADDYDLRALFNNYEERVKYTNLDMSPKLLVKVLAGRTIRTNVTLKYGRLVVASTPPGAAFELGGRPFKTPYTNNFVRPGEVKLQLLLEGHESTNLQAVVPDHGTAVLATELRLPPKGNGLLYLTSDPSGAKLFVGGVPLKDPTPTQPSFAPGQVTIEARLPWPFDQHPVVATFSVETDKTLTNNLQFQYGTLEIQTNDPPSVNVRVDGQDVGASPTNLFLPPGKHSLTYTAPGYETTNREVTIVEKALTSEKPRLKPKDGFIAWTSDPPNATLTASNTATSFTTNVTGLSPLPLPEGDYVVSVAYSTGLTNLKALVERVQTRLNRGQTTNLGKFLFEYGTVVFAASNLLDGAQAAVPVAGATVRLAGRPVELDKVNYQRPNEPVSYTVAANKYLETTTNVTVARDTTELPRVVLPRVRGRVRLLSEPEGATFTIKGTPDANGLVELAWGDLQVTARHGRLPPQTKPLTVALDQTNELKFEFSNYRRLWLTNLTEGWAVYYTNGEAVSAWPNKVAYEPLDAGDTYEVRRGASIQKVKIKVINGERCIPVLTQYYTNNLGMVFVWFDDLRGPGKGGYVGKCEVTQGDYKSLMNTNPSLAFAGLGDNIPVNNLTVGEMLAFCAALSRTDARLATLPPESRGFKYALPQEAQWRYFARGAPTNETLVILRGSKPDAEKKLEAVGNRPDPNYELQDVIGNVAEVCRGDDGKYYYLGEDYRRPLRFALADLRRGELQKKPFADTQKDPGVGLRLVLVPP
jgi:hypothetical protein